MGQASQGVKGGAISPEIPLFFQDLVFVVVLENRQGVLAGGLQDVPEIRQSQLLLGLEVGAGLLGDLLIDLLVQAELGRQHDELPAGDKALHSLKFQYVLSESKGIFNNQVRYRTILVRMIFLYLCHHIKFPIHIRISLETLFYS